MPSDATRLIAILLAAGAASRMGGRDKLLEQVEGVPLLRVVARRVLAAGLPAVVCLRPGAAWAGRWAALADLPLRRVEVPDADEGMAASIRAGIAAVGDASAAMTVLADMPDLLADDFAAVAAAWSAGPPDAIVRGAGADGTPGQPVILPRRLYPALLALTGDTGGRAVLRDQDVALCHLPGRRALTDLDTPEDWAAWRARRG
ncbi:nucleotidyltransferase family protein [Rhodobacteraceae bacterium CCMM004]|nr:nucleotidyltransferase family protein [Rhodobacteraceae bacterium CCMM004]